MAGRGLADGAHLLPEAEASTRNRGLWDRLNSHASERRKHRLQPACRALVYADYLSLAKYECTTKSANGIALPSTVMEAGHGKVRSRENGGSLASPVASNLRNTGHVGHGSATVRTI